MIKTLGRLFKGFFLFYSVVYQLVDYLIWDEEVLGSSPGYATSTDRTVRYSRVEDSTVSVIGSTSVRGILPSRIGVSTPGFGPGSHGSIPWGATKNVVLHFLCEICTGIPKNQL